MKKGQGLWDRGRGGGLKDGQKGGWVLAQRREGLSYSITSQVSCQAAVSHVSSEYLSELLKLCTYIT